MTQRSKDQTLVAFPLDRAFLASVDSVRGSESRSAFIRSALANYLRSKGVDVPPENTVSPDRAGKGGPKKNPKMIKQPVRYDENLAAMAAESPPIESKPKRKKTE